MRCCFPVLIFMLLFLYACRCDKEHTYTFIKKSKDYFASSNTGDQWVYMSSDDSIFTDTLVLLNLSQRLDFKYTETECDGDYFEIIEYQLVSLKDNDTLSVWMKSGPNIDQYRLEGSYQQNTIVCNHIIDKSNGAFQYGSAFGDVLEVFEAYELNHRVYVQAVEITHHQFARSFPEKAPRYVHASGVGLIEFEVYNDLEDERVRYSLMEYIKK